MQRKTADKFASLRSLDTNSTKSLSTALFFKEGNLQSAQQISENTLKIADLMPNFTIRKEITDLISEVSGDPEEVLGQKRMGVSKERSKKRKSKYRGVSMNGAQWQVIIMINKKKRYIGSYKSEDEAALVYDKIAIKLKGEKAKTNFPYSNQEMKEIVEAEIFFAAKKYYK